MKTSLNKAKIVKWYKPEAKWANHEQVENNFNKLLEDWTGECGKILGWFVIRGERLIKLSDSWFSAKSI